MPGLLLINPRAGNGGPSAEDLASEARTRGIDVRILARGDDARSIADAADADAVGMAGGDGSLAAVASACVANDRPFVCVPFGTRNHFARDLGIDRNDPVAALDAFAGEERRVDVGRAGDRVFLNNVSLGAYARLVHRRERRRRRREALARAKALLLSLRDREQERFVVDGERVSARILLVANNAYTLDLLSIGERERLDDGLLHLYAADGIRRATWEERSAPRFVVAAGANQVRAAVDGDPARLETPVEFRIEPLALRVLLPPRSED